MSANRAVFCIVMAIFCALTPTIPAAVWPVLLGAGLPVAGLLFAHLLLRPEPHPVRRIVAMVVDIATISTIMHVGDGAASCFYPLLLWTIFGNGIRFGLRDLAIATACALAGFTAVVLTTPFWIDHPSLSIGLLAGTLIVPIYCSHLIKTLTEAREAAEQATRAKTRFLANISHDLRTPLQALIGTSRLLGATSLTPYQDELVGTCLSAGQSLLHMVNGLLRFTHLQEAPSAPELSAFGPVDVVQHAIRVSAPICIEKGLSITASFLPLLPTTVISDRSRIDEVLLNLIGNAAKFTSAGGVLVTARSTATPEGSCGLRFEVVDTGIGVPESARASIFERFNQGDGAIRMRFGGSGMGLAICQELIAGMGGRIGVDGHDGPGSTFWFEVPVTTPAPAALPPGPATGATPLVLLLDPGPARERLSLLATQQGHGLSTVADPGQTSLILVAGTPVDAEAAARLQRLLSDRPPGHRWATILVDGAPGQPEGPDSRWIAEVRLRQSFDAAELRNALAICEAACRSPNRPAPPAPGRAAGLPAAGAKVLIVDDNRMNRFIFSRMLSEQGYRMSTADDGEHALVALEQGGFDLVIMDVNMPVIDGLQATRLQRVAELGGPRIPIIGLTADGSDATRKECLQAGMDACLTKPVEPEVLLDIVREMLRGRATAQPRPDGHSAGARTGHMPGAVPATVPDVDWKTVGSLEDVGGREFLDDILFEFRSDVDSLARRLDQALDIGDINEVRQTGHAFASVAANVGAAAVRDTGLRVETSSEQEIRDGGHELTRELQGAVQRFLHVLEEGRAGQVPGP